MGFLGGVGAAIGGKVIDNIFGDDDKGGSAANDAARAFMPYGVRGFGGKVRIRETAAGTPQLKFEQPKRLRQITRRFGREADRGLKDSTGRLYRQLSRIAAPGERDLRRSTRRGLYSMGAMGTHSGREMVGEVERALSEARDRRLFQARTQAYNERQGAFQNYMTGTYEPLRVLSGVAMNRNPAAGVAAMGMIQSGVAQDAADAQFASSLNRSLQPAYSAFGDWASEGIGNIFNNFGYGSNDDYVPGVGWLD